MLNIDDAVHMTKRNEAPDFDMINYKHILYLGTNIRPLLAKLFTAMVKLSHILIEMKTGKLFNVDLCKGGTKKRSDPDS